MRSYWKAVIQSRRGRTVGTIVSIAIAAVLLVGIFGQAHLAGAGRVSGRDAQGTSGTRSDQEPVFFAEISNPVGVAATPSELLAVTYNNTTIDSINGDGGYSTFATVPDMDPNCTIMGIAISPGFGGFVKNDVFVAQGPWIFVINAKGTSVKLFTSLDSESGDSSVPTGLTFDTVGSFGYQLIATSEGGFVYTISSSGQTNVVTSLEEVPEILGPSVAPLSFGQFGGDLLAGVGGADSNNVLAIAPNGSAQFFAYWPGATSVTTVPAQTCDFQGTGAYFFADNTSGEIIGMSNESFIPGQGYVTSALDVETPAGIGNFTSAGGAAESFYSTTDAIWASTWVSCPVLGQVVQIQHGNWYPYEMAYDPADEDMYVTDNLSNQVFFFNSNSVVTGQATVGTDSAGVAYDPANNEMLVTNSGSDNVSILNATTNQVTGSIPVGGDPQGIAYDPRNGYAYVADNGTNNLTVIAPDNKPVASVPTDSEPFGVAYDAVNGYIYVADYGGSITIVKGTTEFATISLDGAATGIAQNGVKGRMFATVFGDSQVARIGNGLLLAYFPAGGQPFGIALDPKLGDFVIANHATGTLTILRPPSTVIETLEVGEPGGPWGVAYDPANGLIYVAGELIGDPRTIGGGSG